MKGKVASKVIDNLHFKMLIETLKKKKHTHTNIQIQ